MFELDPNEDEGRSGGSGGGYLGDGTHTVTVTDHEIGEWGNGSEYLEITFEDDNGRTHKERYTLVDAVLWRLRLVFRAAGFTSKIDLHKSGMIRKAIHDKPMVITLGPGKPRSNGKTYREVRRIEAATTRREERQPNGGAPRDAGRNGSGRGEQRPDDDIPF